VRWNLRMKAAERGIWKSTELRRMLAEAGLEISTGKMSGWWTGTPNTIRLDELDVICHVLDCEPSELLIPEPDKVASRRPPQTQTQTQTAQGTRPSPVVAPRFSKGRSEPPV
jgi:DNA-binding Xre family transcriptional regulator